MPDQAPDLRHLGGGGAGGGTEQRHRGEPSKRMPSGDRAIHRARLAQDPGLRAAFAARR
jgi:hypothetical protein